MSTCRHSTSWAASRSLPVVTAASVSGMARGLAQAGAAIAVAGRNLEKSEAAAAELSAKGVKTAVVDGRRDG